MLLMDWIAREAPHPESSCPSDVGEASKVTVADAVKLTTKTSSQSFTWSHEHVLSVSYTTHCLLHDIDSKLPKRHASAFVTSNHCPAGLHPVVELPLLTCSSVVPLETADLVHDDSWATARCLMT